MYNIKATVSSLPQDASAIANLFMASMSLDLVLSGRAMCVVCAACVCSMCVWGGRREECEGGVLGGEIHLPKKSITTQCTGHVDVCTIQYVCMYQVPISLFTLYRSYTGL